MGGLRPSRRGLCTQQGLKRQASPETPYHTFRYDTSEDFETEGAYDGKPSALKGRASPVSQDDDYRFETSKDQTILPNGRIPKCLTDYKFDLRTNICLCWKQGHPLSHERFGLGSGVECGRWRCGEDRLTPKYVACRFLTMHRQPRNLTVRWAVHAIETA
ncbi:hypothetical protein V2G26_015418 [Clonostachys chloroleuca]